MISYLNYSLAGYKILIQIYFPSIFLELLFIHLPLLILIWKIHYHSVYNLFFLCESFQNFLFVFYILKISIHCGLFLICSLLFSVTYFYSHLVYLRNLSLFFSQIFFLFIFFFFLGFLLLNDQCSAIFLFQCIYYIFILFFFL